MMIASTISSDRPWSPRACLFDFDGLLVDTRRHWHQTYFDLAARFAVSPERLDLAALNGASVRSAARGLSTQLGVKVDQTLVIAGLLSALDEVTPALLPGVRRLMQALCGRIPIAVVTNGPMPFVESALVATGLRPYFDLVVSADHVEAEKPAPHIYRAACQKLAVSASDSVAFEDSMVGVRAAKSAELFVVGVPSITGERLDADLCVGQVDDPRVFSLLRLPVRS
jgi:sugar-phosphatase